MAGMHYRKRKINFLAIGLCVAAVGAILLLTHVGPVAELVRGAAYYSAALLYPNGSTGNQLFAPGDGESVSSQAPEEEPPAVQEIFQVSRVDSPLLTDLPEGMKPVLEQTRDDTGNLITYEGISIQDKTLLSPSIDIAALLERETGVTFDAETHSAQVLIIHTHATECYETEALGYYDPDKSGNSLDSEIGVIKVGQALKTALEARGIGVIHDTSTFDYPSYSGAYLRARERIEKILDSNPQIQMVIDLHRGIIQQTGGARVKPTVEINGEKAAQIMLIAGCDADGSLGFENWEDNLSIALRVQEKLGLSAPSLARPLSLEARKYNFDMTRASFAVEIGTDVNTVEECTRSAQVLAKAIADALAELPAPAEDTASEG